MKPASTTRLALALALTLTQVGFATASADTYRADVELSTQDIGAKETVLGDVIADAARAAADSDVGIIAASSFADGVTIPKGTFGAADILKTLEYTGDTVVVVKLTGDQIQRALEHGLYLYPKFNSGFLQYSGMVVTVDSGADRSRRVLSVKIGGQDLQNGRKYAVAMPSPLADGALGYFKIWKQSDIDHDTHKTLANAITGYLDAHRTITKGPDRFVPKSR